MNIGIGANCTIMLTGSIGGKIKAAIPWPHGEKVRRSERNGAAGTATN